MAVTVRQIRDGLAANLSILTTAIEGLTVSSKLQSNPQPPLIHIGPDRVDYDEAMNRGLDVWQMKAQAFVGLIDDGDAQDLLDLMLNPTGSYSVKQAAERDPTLGGLPGIAGLQVLNASGYRTYLLEGQGAVLGCEWAVQVKAVGN